MNARIRLYMAARSTFSSKKVIIGCSKRVGGFQGMNIIRSVSQSFIQSGR